MDSKPFFRNSTLPYLLVAPQLLICLVFFFWPATEALIQSVMHQDPFGLSTQFAGLENFSTLFSDPYYLHTIYVTFVFSGCVTGIGIVLALLLAAVTERVGRFGRIYRTLMIWPYAVAPAVAGALWLFLFTPGIGVLTIALKRVGVDWDHINNGSQAMVLIIIIAVWSHISFNYLFFTAAYQSIPRSLIEASSLEGAGSFRRFFDIVLPLMSPTIFYLIVMNTVFSFFYTFEIIHAVTQGGPAKETETLVYKVWRDAFVGLDLGGSAAQSVVLMLIVVVLTVVQFRYVERKVHY